MSTTRLTWRPATADDVGRLCRYKECPDDESNHYQYGLLSHSYTFDNGQCVLRCNNAVAHRCEVQDVEAEDGGIAVMSKYAVAELSRVTAMALSDERLSQSERDDIKHVVGMVEILASRLAYYRGTTVVGEQVRVSNDIKNGKDE